MTRLGVEMLPKTLPGARISSRLRAVMSPVTLPYHDRGPGDLRVDDRALADGECVLRGDLALHLALDADRPLEGELAADPATLAEERARSARLVHLGRLVALEHLPLPWRRIPGRHRGS